MPSLDLPRLLTGLCHLGPLLRRKETTNNICPQPGDRKNPLHDQLAQAEFLLLSIRIVLRSLRQYFLLLRKMIQNLEERHMTTH